MDHRLFMLMSCLIFIAVTYVVKGFQKDISDYICGTYITD